MSAQSALNAAKPGVRRTQAERSNAMRRRLLAATVESLAEEGYAGSTLSSIVRRAGVSRGAQVHHYPNKQALILDAAEDLMRRSYRALGAVLLSVAKEDDRLEALIKACWDSLFATPMYRAYTELLIASQRDPVLAEALRQMLQRVRGVFEPAVEHYFEPAPGSGANPKALFLQMSCLLAGLAVQAHVIQNPSLIHAQLTLWSKQAGSLMYARKGVRTPPPRPAAWDRPARG
ncbi:MAG: TetR/AcrR family transcriptional regulator [Nevskia sp.]|nr:TetR/AcrR family transcriptional regulator [Nevskia sp.]